MLESLIPYPQSTMQLEPLILLRNAQEDLGSNTEKLCAEAAT